jgi:metal-dependent amidase/aminoacylase/carboxypeptidase family protein
LKDVLQGFGIEKIKSCAKTGLVVDIEGKSYERVIALRADIDALPMPENNPLLAYKTITPYAHMCGHDGHMAMLVCAAKVLQ